MSRVDSSGSDLDLDIDLESGGTTSEEDSSKILSLDSANSKNLLGRIRSGLTSCKSLGECTNGEECSCSYDKLTNSDEISATDTEQLGKFRQKLMNYGDATTDEEKPKKQNFSKPPRPPRGPSLDASDMKLLKDISELNLKRRRMERIRALKKIKKEKASSLSVSLFACLLTLVFLLVIIFQGLLGSRT